MWATIVRIILRNRLAFLIGIGFVTILMAFFAIKNFKMSYEFAQILPQSDSTQITYKNFKNRFGQDGSVVVIGVNTEDISNLEDFNGWYDLSRSISKLNGVDTVVSIAQMFELKKVDDKLKLIEFPSQKPKSQSEVDSLIDEVHKKKFYEGILFNQSEYGEANLMAITLDKKRLNTKERDNFIKEIETLADNFSQKHSVEIFYSGLPFIRTKTTIKVKRELNLFILGAALIMAIILLIFFRSFKIVGVSMLVVFIAVIWVFGTIGLLGYEITILTGLIPPLIIVIGIPNCIFLINKFHQEYFSHGNKIKAISRIVQKIGNATFLTNLTTAAGFATFSVTTSKILQEFGIVASLNIMGVFVISLLIIPIIFSYMAPPTTKNTKHLENKGINAIVSKLIFIVNNRRSVVYTVTIILVLVGFYGVKKIKTTGNIVDDIPHHDPIYTHLNYFENHFKGVMPFEIEINTKKKNGVFDDNAATLYKIKKLNKIFTKDTAFSNYFARPISLVDAISFAYQAHKGGDSKFYVLPPPTELKKLQSYTNNKESKTGQSFKSFIDSTSQYTRVSLSMANIGTNKIQEIKENLKPLIDEIFPPEEYKVSLTGTSVVFLEGTTYLIENLFVSLALAVIIIALFMTWMFSSFKMVVVSLIPNVLPLLFTAAAMGYFGISIKPSTILVFSIAFGISVDDTIHYLAKYRQELFKNNGDIIKSVITALKETGMSMIYTSIILFFGFSVFALSSFGGTVALGILVSFTLLIAMLSNLLLLPSLILTTNKFFKIKVYREPMLQILDEEEDIDLEDLEIVNNDDLNKEEKEIEYAN